MTDGPMNAVPVDRHPFSARGTFFPSLTGRPPSGTIHPVQLQQNADCVRFRFPPEQDSGVPQPALTLATTDVPIRCRRIQRGITQFAKFRRDLIDRFVQVLEELLFNWTHIAIRIKHP